MNRDQLQHAANKVMNIWPRPEIPIESVSEYAGGMADLPYEETMMAINRLKLTSKYRPALREIREQVVDVLGLAPPSTEGALRGARAYVEALEQAKHYNRSGWEPPKIPTLTPLTQRIISEMDTSHPSWEAIFRKTYSAAARAEVDRLIKMNMSAYGEHA